MFNEYLFCLGEICLPHPYTTASLIFLLHWQILPNVARECRIWNCTNFDQIYGETNRIRSNAFFLNSKLFFSVSGCARNVPTSSPWVSEDDRDLALVSE